MLRGFSDLARSGFRKPLEVSRNSVWNILGNLISCFPLVHARGMASSEACIR